MVVLVVGVVWLLVASVLAVTLGALIARGERQIARGERRIAS